MARQFPDCMGVFCGCATAMRSTAAGFFDHVDSWNLVQCLDVKTVVYVLAPEE